MKNMITLVPRLKLNISAATLSVLFVVGLLAVADARAASTTAASQPASADKQTTEASPAAATSTGASDQESTQSADSPAAMQANATTSDEGDDSQPDLSQATKSFLGPLDYKVDSQSGRFTYQIPLVVPPARQGAQPQLSLAYNSSGGNGWCGVGWNLDTGFIQRDARHGVPIAGAQVYQVITHGGHGQPVTITTNYLNYNILPQYDDARGFIANIGGSGSDLVLVGPTNQNPLIYRQAIETAFVTYKYYNDNHWEIVDKSGNTFYFGETAASRMENTKTGWTPNAGQSTFRWALDKVIDINGNLTTLNYTKEGGMLYLSNISYNGNINAPALATTHTVDFILTDRPDTNIAFNTGFRVETRKRLSEVQMKVSGAQVRKYVLNYASSPSTRRSLLASVTQYGSDFTTPLPTLTFGYQVKPFEFEADMDWPLGFYCGDSWDYIRLVSGNRDTSVTVADIDADGLPDRVEHDYYSPYDVYCVERNTGTRFVTRDNDNYYGWGMLDHSQKTGWEWNGPARTGDDGANMVGTFDINGDGYPDRVVRDATSPFTAWYVQTNSGVAGGAGFGPVQVWPVAAETSTDNSTWRGIRFPKTVDTMDMNGDGLPDRVMRQLDAPYNRFKVQLNTGSGFTGMTDWYPVYGQDDASDLIYTSSDITILNVGNIASKLKAHATNDPVSVYLYNRLSSGTQNLLSHYLNLKELAALLQALINDLNGIIQSGSIYDPVRFAGVTPSGETMTWLGSQPLLGMDFIRLNRSLLHDAYGLPSVGLPNADWRDLNEQGGGMRVILADINGDGLPDRVMRKKDAPYTNLIVQFNNGAGFEPPENWMGLENQGKTDSASWNAPMGADGSHTWADLVDINGDGLPDRVMRRTGSPYTNWVVQLNTGSGFAPAVSWGGLDSQGKTSDTSWNNISALSPNSNNSGDRTYVDFFDINGDGLPDRVMRRLNDPWDRFVVQLNKGPFPDLLCVVSNGLGGTVRASYVPSTQYDNRDKDWTTDPWTEGAKSLLSYPVQTVSQIVISDGLGGSNVTTYAYKGGYFNAAKRDYRGFHRVQVTDPYGLKTVTYFHQGGGYDGSANGEFQDQEGKQGIPYLVETYDTNNVPLERVLNKVESAQLGSGSCFPYISQIIKMAYADGTHYRATAEQIVYDTSNGNVHTNLNLGKVANVNLSAHSFDDLDSTDNIRTETTYKTGNPILVSKPDVMITSKVDMNQPRKTRFNYDSHGNPTSSEVWLIPGDRWITKQQAQYDSCGNLYRAIDAAGIVTEIAYDSAYQMFPVKKTVAPGTSLEMSDLTQFDPLSGQVLRATNHLGLITRTDYDVFFRPTATYINQQPNAEPTLWRTKSDYHLNGIAGTTSNNKIHAQMYDPNDTLNGIESFAYLDGLGRTIQTRTESETNNVFRCSDAYFANNGRDDFAPLPYFGNGSAYVARTETQLGSFTEYNAAGRSTKLTPAAQATYNASRQRVGSVTLTGGDANAPVAASIMAYGEGADPWVTIATDAEGKAKKIYADAFGRLISITNIFGQSTIFTHYYYDFVGNLTRVTDNAGNNTDITYDSLNRKTAMSDPDMGSWTYAYDDAGRMTDECDAKGQHTHFNHESILGRLQYMDIYDSANNLKRRVEYRYDGTAAKPGCNVPLGMLASVTETSTSCNCTADERFWSYDYKGRVLKEGVYSWAFGGTFVTTNRYNEADQVVELSYPNDVARLIYTYQNGVLKKVQSLKGTGDHSETFYELTSINEMGQPVEYLTHNGQVKNRHEYYANSKRIQTISVTKGTNSLLNKIYSFDRVSNVTNITDSVPDHTGSSSGTLQNLHYDDLHRLIGLTDASGSHSYQYDTLGNITMNGEWASGTYTYGSSRPHAVTAANGKTYQYDANGNMTNRNGQTLVYDEENRLIQVTNSSCNVHFGYGFDGTRLWKYNKINNQYTCYISPLYEYRESDTAGLCYVFAGGQRIAAFRPTSDIYNLAVAPLSWDGRLLTFTQRMSTKANLGLMWAFSPKHMQTTTFNLAMLLTLALVLIGRFWTRVRLERREQRFYFQPLWQRALCLLLIPTFLLATTPAHAAFVPGEVFYYYHTDHLGSSNITTDRNGNVIQQYEYKAYGDKRFLQDNAAGHPEYDPTYRYTGQAFDDDTGLYYYGARYYDPELGRFTQADTMVPSAAIPQTLNRYAYCGNNPLKYVDPTGHDFGLTELIITVVVCAAIGGATAAATGGDIGKGILFGAIGGLCGGGGAVIGAAAGATSAVGATLGQFIGTVIGAAAGGVISAGVNGGDIGLGALVGGIGGAIAFGVGQLGFAPSEGGSLADLDFGQNLANAGLSAVGGAVGGAIGAAITGGDPGFAALCGAAGGAAGYGLTAMYDESTLGLSIASHKHAYLDAKLNDKTSISLTIHGGDDYTELLNSVVQRNAQIVDFRYVGHADSVHLECGDPNSSLIWLPKEKYFAIGQAGTGAQDGLKSINALMQKAFAPNAHILLRGCDTYSFWSRNSIAGGFKQILPNAVVKGYTVPVVSTFLVGGKAALWPFSAQVR